jgi:hypothetical protein
LGRRHSPVVPGASAHRTRTLHIRTPREPPTRRAIPGDLRSRRLVVHEGQPASFSQLRLRDRQCVVNAGPVVGAIRRARRANRAPVRDDSAG